MMSLIKQPLTRKKVERLAYIGVALMSLTLLLSLTKRTATIKLDQGQLVYQGQVGNHRPDGKGVLEYANGDRYEGQFKNGVFHGKGTFKSHAGWTYNGEFKNGQADGKGVLQTEDKAVYEGTFKQGIYQK